MTEPVERFKAGRDGGDPRAADEILVDFLRARLDEDEAVAKAAADDGGAPWALSDYVDRVGDTAQDVVTLRDAQGETLAANNNYGDLGDDEIRHIARWDPARVLAEIDAKRQIVDEYAAIDVDANRLNDAAMHLTWTLLGNVVRELAVPYASHTDYRPEWRPVS